MRAIPLNLAAFFWAAVLDATVTPVPSEPVETGPSGRGFAY